MDSILTSIKKLLGVAEEYTQFDPDIVMHINSVLMILAQMGVGPEGGFIIEDETAVWNDFIPEATPIRLEAVKSYIYLKVRLLFDSSSMSSAVLESINRQIAELEWRLYVAAESSII